MFQCTCTCTTHLWFALNLTMLSCCLTTPTTYNHRQLLNECGIGVDDTGDNDQSLTSGSVVSQHRVLLFCQYKSILDIIESDLFK